MNTKKIFLALILSLLASSSFAEESLQDKATAFYQSGQWAEAASAYQKIVQQEPENVGAWFRLANAYLGNRQGELTLEALDKAAIGEQIPANQIAYQRARAYSLMGDADKMWAQLEVAIEGGYRNTANFDEAEEWQKYRSSERFQKLRSVVDENAKPCIHDKRFREFDFWVGDWEVYGNAEKTGALYGTNKIETMHDGCLILENWSGASGTNGTSMNYFDGTKNKWVQHWMSMGGTTINIEGGLVDGAMSLTGKIYYLNGPTPQVRDFRALWTPHESGYVRQFFEESTDEGKTWYPWFEGFYFPKSETAKE